MSDTRDITSLLNEAIGADFRAGQFGARFEDAPASQRASLPRLEIMALQYKKIHDDAAAAMGALLAEINKRNVTKS